MTQGGDPWSVTTPNIPSGPDHLDLYNATREADRLSDKLMGMKDELADAKMILEYDSERRKNALSKAVLVAFKAGADNSTKAEHEARSSAAYDAALHGLAKNYALAERVRQEFDGIKIRLDVLRTMISTQKSMMEML